MIQVKQGDITKLREIDVIVNAANGIGVMGRGVAGAISRSGGQAWSNRVRNYCRENGPFEAGQCYSDGDAGLLKRQEIQEVYHAVTMKYPGGPTSVEYVVSAVQNACRRAIDAGYDTIAFPGMGTGVGGLDKQQVAYRMATELLGYTNRIQIIVVDMNEEFIRFFKKAIGQNDEIERENHGDYSRDPQVPPERADASSE